MKTNDNLTVNPDGINENNQLNNCDDNYKIETSNKQNSEQVPKSEQNSVLYHKNEYQNQSVSESNNIYYNPYLYTNEQTFNSQQKQNSIITIIKNIIKKITSHKKATILSLALTFVFVMVLLFSSHILCFHKWQSATCTLPEICSICSKTQGVPLGHTEGPWRVITSATLNESGKKEQKCIVCDELLDSSIITKKAATTSTGFNFEFDEVVKFINNHISSSYKVSETHVTDGSVDLRPVYENGKYMNIGVSAEDDSKGNVKTLIIVADNNQDTAVALMCVIANSLFGDFIDMNDNSALIALYLKQSYISSGVKLTFATTGSTTMITLRPNS